LFFYYRTSCRYPPPNRDYPITPIRACCGTHIGAYAPLGDTTTPPPCIAASLLPPPPPDFRMRTFVALHAHCVSVYHVLLPLRGSMTAYCLDHCDATDVTTPLDARVPLLRTRVHTCCSFTFWLLRTTAHFLRMVLRLHLQHLPLPAFLPLRTALTVSDLLQHFFARQRSAYLPACCAPFPFTIFLLYMVLLSTPFYRLLQCL